MKKNKILLGLALIVVLIFITIVYMGRILFVSNEYVALDKDGQKISEITIYNRKDNGLILRFNEPIIESFVIFPNDKIIGMPNGGSQGIVKLFGGLAFQKKKTYDIFTIMFNQGTYNKVFFEDKLLIENCFFEGDQIRLEMVKGFTDYDEIIVSKISVENH